MHAWLLHHPLATPPPSHRSPHSTLPARPARQLRSHRDSVSGRPAPRCTFQRRYPAGPARTTRPRCTTTMRRRPRGHARTLCDGSTGLGCAGPLLRPHRRGSLRCTPAQTRSLPHLDCSPRTSLSWQRWHHGTLEWPPRTPLHQPGRMPGFSVKTRCCRVPYPELAAGYQQLAGSNPQHRETAPAPLHTAPRDSETSRWKSVTHQHTLPSVAVLPSAGPVLPPFGQAATATMPGWTS